MSAADARLARASLGRVPLGRPPQLEPGERHWRMYQVHSETSEEAIARARSSMPWGGKIRGTPALCRGVWMFAGRP